MSFAKKNVVLYILWFQLLINLPVLASSTHYHFRVKEAPYTRLCNTKKILTVNGQFPGPTLGVYHGETIHVTVHNKGSSNITIHWHGVNQPRYPWTDGPAYITQCPIQPGAKFKQKIILSTEEGTLWWHAHSHWDRATVHGAIIVYPKPGTAYPFFKPHMEVPIILGEWWKNDVRQVLEESLTTGGTPNVSDAFTVNGQPGDLYPCSKSGTFKLNVDQGKIYLLRIINAAMNDILFFAIARHKLIVVGADGCYTKPLERKYITIAPGQTIDALLHANKDPNKDSHSYYMAARAYSPGAIPFDNTTTTAIIQYNNGNSRSSNSSTPLFPSSLPHYNDTSAAFRFLGSLRSIPNDTDHQPAGVPLKIDAQIVTTISINAFPCPKNQTCEGPNGTKLAASMNNISFANPSIDILDSYFKHIKGVFGKKFPSFPPLVFNFTAPYLPLELEIPSRGTQVKVLHYDSSVEIIFQGTSLVSGLDHPMHLHGYSFYVVGRGFGNFDKDKDPQHYNLIDPPLRNTVIVPINGWAAIRFRANNPGIWFMHCHLERHLSWGMNTVFLVKNGKGPEATLLPPPPDMPPC